MDEIIKLVHIASVCLMFGATMSNGVLHLMARSAGLTEARQTLLAAVMAVNKRAMGPSFFGIVISGFLMVIRLDLTLGALWLWLSISLTAVLVSGFIIGYSVEAKLEKITQEKLKGIGEDHAKRYGRTFKMGLPIGSGAALISLAIIYLMIAKPH